MEPSHPVSVDMQTVATPVVNVLLQKTELIYQRTTQVPGGTGHQSQVQEHSLARRQLLFFLFMLSGFSGLIYESIWAQYLKLFLGHAAYAQTLVLMIFMGGMAIGSWFTARSSSKWHNLLLAYAIIEGLIGLCALGFHGVFTKATAFTYAYILPTLPSATAASLFKWSLATALILPQSILLGMTFPLMSGGLLRRFPEQSGSTIAMLYFTNSIGAVAGILTSGFILISLIGLPGTMLTAGLINFALALTVWLLSKGEVEFVLDPRPGAISLAPTPAISPSLLLTVALVTGTSSFMYEIGWIRMLSFVLGSSTHSFEIMLSAFILGLAFGGLWIKQRIDHIENQVWFLGLVQVMMGLFALSTLPLYNNTFQFMAFVMEALKRNEAGYLFFNFSAQLVSLFIMLPTTFCAGMTLPLLTAILLRFHQGEKAIGNVYAANTIGAIVGIALAVHFFMPILGLKGVIASGAALDVVLGWILLWKAHTTYQRRAFLGLVALGFATLLGVIGGVRLDPYQMASGVYRYGWSSLPRNHQILFHQDGKTATINLSRQPGGKMSISTNGKPDAAIEMGAGQPPTPDEATMTMAAAVALGFRLEAKTIANIGMGSGMTSHVLLASPYLQRLDTIEIEPAMVAAAQGFRPRVEAVFTDPRSHIHFEDAKSFFSTRQQQYDIIVSEPSNPWVSGVSGLFSKEFYHLLKDYLQPDGILIQWVQQYEFTVELFASIIQALEGNFSDYALFSSNDGDIIIVAKKIGDLGQLDERLLSQPRVAEELAKVSLQGLPDLELRRIGNRKGLLPFFATVNVPTNSDYYPYVDQHAAKARFTGSNARLLTYFGTAPLPLLEMLTGQAQWLGSPITAAPQFSRSLAVTNAKVLKNVFLTDSTGNIGKIEFKDHALAILLSLPVPQCQSHTTATLWRDALFNLAKAVLPYLSPQELQPMWEKIEATPCVRVLPNEHLEWLALFKAVGNRDSSTMATLAGSILEQSQARQDRDRYRYLVAAQLLGLLSQGKQQEARTAWAPHAATFQAEESYLRLLSAYVTAPLTEQIGVQN